MNYKEAFKILLNSAMPESGKIWIPRKDRCIIENMIAASSEKDLALLKDISDEEIAKILSSIIDQPVVFINKHEYSSGYVIGTI